MKILVTGGAGFIASHIVDKLISFGHKIVIIDNLSTGKSENINKQAIFYFSDINDIDRLKVIFKVEKPEVVIHHAAQISVQTSIKYPVLDENTNIQGTISLLECCKEFKVRKIIYSSSAAVYGEPQYLPLDENHPIQPMSFYGISKYTPEIYIKMYSALYGIKYTIFRYSNVYGIRQDAKGEGGVVSIFIDKLLHDEPVIIYGDGEQSRDFVYVKDIAEANSLALIKSDNCTLNLSSNQCISINNLFIKINNIFDKKVSPIYEEKRDGDIRHSYMKNDEAKKILGWSPKYILEQGLKETVNYYANLYNHSEFRNEENYKDRLII